MSSIGESGGPNRGCKRSTKLEEETAGGNREVERREGRKEEEGKEWGRRRWEDEKRRKERKATAEGRGKGRKEEIKVKAIRGKKGE